MTISGLQHPRDVERRLQRLERHNHPDPASATPAGALTARLQVFLVGGGVRRVDSTGVSWSNSLLLEGMGVSPLAPTGQVVISMPANGTVIPVHGGVSASATVSGGVIPVGANETLYWDVPMAAGATSSGFHILGTASAAQPPPNWVLIVTRANVSGATPYRWGDGVTHDFVRAPTFANGWTNYGAPYQSAGYYKDGARVVVTGMVANGTVGQNVFVLPTGYRPLERQVYTQVGTGNAIARVDVFDTGDVRCIAAGGNSFLSLDGISFRFYQ